jgi:hypothetical protein
MARTRTYAGICGFTTVVEATSEDRQHVTIQIHSGCPDIQRLAKKINGKTYDAYVVIGPCAQPGSIYDTEIMQAAGLDIPHVACPVPAGIHKAIEVAAGLALPRDAKIAVVAEDADKPKAP